MTEPIYASREAEQSVLGSLMLDDRLFPQVRAKIDAADFFWPEHRAIFNAICRLISHGTSVDVVTVAEEFSDASLAEIGGAQYLSRIVDLTPSYENAEAYAGIVKRDSVKRSAMAEVSELLQKLQGDADPSELLLQFRDAAAKMISPTAQGTANLAEKFIFKALEAMDTEEPDWLIDGYLPADGFSVIYGKSEAYKTFIAMDMCCAISTGGEWHGNETKKCPVLYVSAEGQRGINYRKRAWEIKNKQNADLLGILGQALDMTDPAIAVSLSMAIDRFESDIGIRPGLLVLDTLNRCFGDGDENSTQDMTRFIQSIGALQAQTGIAVMVIHHSGKDDSKGMRGNSSLRAALDTEYLVTRPDPDQPRTILRNTKVKDADRPAELMFDMRVVELKKQDKKGKMMTSLVPEKAEFNNEQGVDLIAALVRKAESNGKVASHRFLYDDWRNQQPPGMSDADLKERFGHQIRAAIQGDLIRADEKNNYRSV